MKRLSVFYNLIENMRKCLRVYILKREIAIKVIPRLYLTHVRFFFIDIS